ncbi:MAG: GNAT family N-acetyltransferase [Flavobacteriales bacterium]|nr:MAG: GNAT family N-acetyltransferase [Flavobacteriales bacterium]
MRPATVEDIPAIRSIAHATWPVAYVPSILDVPQLDYMLELLYSERALSEAMTKKDQRFIMMNDGERDIAFAGYTLHYHGSRVTHLNKLYVLPGKQGTGSGKKLVDLVVKAARQAGDEAVELNVNKRNVAITFYQHMGFRIHREEVIDIGQGYVMDDYVMSLPLRT